MSVPRVILASLEINAAETSSTQNFNAQTLRNNKKINRAHTKKKSFAKRNATAINGPPKEEEDEKEQGRRAGAWPMVPKFLLEF